MVVTEPELSLLLVVVQLLLLRAMHWHLSARPTHIAVHRQIIIAMKHADDLRRLHLPATLIRLQQGMIGHEDVDGRPRCVLGAQGLTSRVKVGIMGLIDPVGNPGTIYKDSVAAVEGWEPTAEENNEIRIRWLVRINKTKVGNDWDVAMQAWYRTC